MISRVHGVINLIKVLWKVQTHLKLFKEEKETKIKLG